MSNQKWLEALGTALAYVEDRRANLERLSEGLKRTISDYSEAQAAEAAAPPTAEPAPSIRRPATTRQAPEHKAWKRKTPKTGQGVTRKDVQEIALSLIDEADGPVSLTRITVAVRAAYGKTRTPVAQFLWQAINKEEPPMIKRTGVGMYDRTIPAKSVRVERSQEEADAVLAEARKNRDRVA